MNSPVAPVVLKKSRRFIVHLLCPTPSGRAFGPWPSAPAPGSQDTSHRLAGRLDRGHNPHVGTTAAQVALHVLQDLGPGGVRFLLQEGAGAQDHAGRAIAALESVVLLESLLN